MQPFWLMRLFPVLLLLLSFSASVFAGGQTHPFPTSTYCGDNGGSWVVRVTYPGSGLTQSTVGYDCKKGTSVIAQEGTSFCVASAFPVNSVCRCPVGTTKVTGSPNDSCACPSGKIQNATTGLCEDPPPLGCQYPKEDDGNGGCKCPDGQYEEGETCKSKPDCSAKQADCSTSCGGSAGSMSNVAYFYCEASTASDPSTQLFSGVSYKCECNQQGACPSGKVQVYATDGAASCGDSKNPGCPQGSYYGEFSGQTGCIAPSSHNDPDETPNNCMTGTNPVYYGSTLYCVPQPDSTTCPTGTTSFVTDTGLKICKRVDNQGNSTGDSPDTNGYVKGTSASGSGSGTGDGTGSGSGTASATGAYDAAMSARLSDIKANTDNIKASAALTTANTQATANNTADIKKNTDDINKALTGTMPSTTKGSFTDSIAQLTTETDQLKTDLSTKFDQIKASLYQRFTNSGSPTGSGSLPCFEGFTFLNQNIQFCFTQFNDKLQIIGQFIVGFGFLLAAFIVLRKD